MGENNEHLPSLRHADGLRVRRQHGITRLVAGTGGKHIFSNWCNHWARHQNLGDRHGIPYRTCLFCGLANAYFLLLWSCGMGIFIGRRNLFPHWHHARFLSLVYIRKQNELLPRKQPRVAL